MLDLKVMGGGVHPVRWLGCVLGRKQECFDLLWTHAAFIMTILIWPWVGTHSAGPRGSFTLLPSPDSIHPSVYPMPKL